MKCSQCEFWNTIDGCRYNGHVLDAPCAHDDADSVYDIPYNEDIVEIEEEPVEIADVDEKNCGIENIGRIELINHKTGEVLKWSDPTPGQVLAIEAVVQLANWTDPFIEIIETYNK